MGNGIFPKRRKKGRPSFRERTDLFYLIQHGDQFITDYGVVEFVADCKQYPNPKSDPKKKLKKEPWWNSAYSRLVIQSLCHGEILNGIYSQRGLSAR